jgi:hypothetical protein
MRRTPIAGMQRVAEGGKIYIYIYIYICISCVCYTSRPFHLVRHPLYRGTLLRYGATYSITLSLSLLRNSITISIGDFGPLARCPRRLANLRIPCSWIAREQSCRQTKHVEASKRLFTFRTDGGERLRFHCVVSNGVRATNENTRRVITT